MYEQQYCYFLTSACYSQKTLDSHTRLASNDCQLVTPPYTEDPTDTAMQSTKSPHTRETSTGPSA